MKQEEYLTLQKFNDEAAARELMELLDQNDISHQEATNNGFFDPTFSKNELGIEIRVKIKREDFLKASELTMKLAEAEMATLDKDYYLYGFTDEELMEIVTRPDTWNQLDYLMSQKLLKERGKEINPEVAKVMKDQRLKELAKPAESMTALIYGGYMLAIMGGLLAIFLGWHLATHKRTLPNGDRVYAYTFADRNHGTYIFLLGIVGFIVWTAYSIIRAYWY
jgi:hypothetical protein